MRLTFLLHLIAWQTVATQDKLNAAISKAIAAAIPSGLSLPVGSSLASVPQTVYTQAVPPIPSLLQRLQDFRAAAVSQFQSAPNQHATVEGRRNQHWREVAVYDNRVFPLYLYLENVDWHKVVAWHKARWHAGFINSLWFQMRDRGLGYVGRKIQRDRLRSGSTYRIKLALPIPTPAEHAQRELRESQELYAKVFADRAAQEQEAAPDRRRFLAEQLKRAATHLGRFEPSRISHSKDWQPKRELKQAVEPESAHWQNYLSADELGQLLATVENFWQHWHAFHEAEQEDKDKPVEPAVHVSVVTAPLALSTLHPTIQQAAASRFTSGHYSDAIQKACTALEKAVQAKAGQPATVTGTSLMTTAFSKNSPLIQVAADPNEQLGFMNLYQGTVQALRNHYAHNLTELSDPARALEWLGFVSALFYKLEEA